MLSVFQGPDELFEFEVDNGREEVDAMLGFGHAGSGPFELD